MKIASVVGARPQFIKLAPKTSLVVQVETAQDVKRFEIRVSGKGIRCHDISTDLVVMNKLHVGCIKERSELLKGPFLLFGFLDVHLSLRRSHS